MARRGLARHPVLPGVTGAEAAIARVAARVRQGGNDIPADVIRRRFAAGRANFKRIYRHAVDDWLLYDNAGEEPLLLDWKEQR